MCIRDRAKKNEVLEYLGSSGDHWDYMTKTIKEHNKKIINLNYGGKKKKVTRKEQVDKDILVFMEDDLGNKSSVLQSKINEMQAEAGDKEMFAKYYEMNPQKKSLFKEVVKRGVFDYKGKPSKKGYPDKEPAQLDPKTGMHPEYGKKYKHDKLDPHSALNLRIVSVLLQLHSPYSSRTVDYAMSYLDLVAQVMIRKH